MKAGLKDKLILLLFNQGNDHLISQGLLANVVFEASLLDLVSMRRLAINQGIWHISDIPTGDPVLDEVLGMIKPRDGKNVEWFSLNRSIKTYKLLEMQLNWMAKNRWVEAKIKSIMDFPVYYKLRIIKPEMVRPEMLDLERVLIYGRKPRLDTWLTIQLLGRAGNLKKHFRSSESRSRAFKSYRESWKMPPGGMTDAHVALISKIHAKQDEVKEFG